MFKIRTECSNLQTTFVNKNNYEFTMAYVVQKYMKWFVMKPTDYTIQCIVDRSTLSVNYATVGN